ncbi:MAG: hypothetical protein AAF492_19125, partial [Verrucomicrobiota bacterium]
MKRSAGRVNFVGGLVPTGYVVVGTTDRFTGGVFNQVLMLLLDTNGNLLRAIIYGTPTDEWQPNHVIQTSDGGFLVCGDMSKAGGGPTDMFLLKTFDDGTLDWLKFYPIPKNDSLHQVIETGTGDFAAVGFSENWGSVDISLLKTDPTGLPAWLRVTIGSEEDVGNGLLELNDGGFAIAASTRSLTGDWDGLMVRTFNTGIPMLSAVYGWGGHDEARAITRTPSGNLALAGFTQGPSAPPTAPHYAWLYRTDTNATTVASRIYGWGFEPGYAYSVEPASFDVQGYYMVGEGEASPSNLNLKVVRTDPNAFTETQFPLHADCQYLPTPKRTPIVMDSKEHHPPASDNPFELDVTPAINEIPVPLPPEHRCKGCVPCPFTSSWRIAGTGGLTPTYHWLRDEYLVEHELGRMLINDFNTVSPAVSALLDKDTGLAVRLALLTVEALPLLLQLREEPDQPIVISQT